MPQKTFYFENTRSPTQYNLTQALLATGWQQASSRDNADFTDAHLSLNERYTRHLEYKHLLAELCQQYCPNIIPKTYCIDDNNYQAILQGINDHDDTIWILKPALLNNGEGIHLFNQLAAIKQYFQQSKRFAGPHVLQHYIKHPHLLHGHKYTFRMFVIITNNHGIYLYHDGYYNVSRQIYQPHQWQQRALHLTNEHLNDDDNVWQIPTCTIEHFEPIYQQINNIVHCTTQALRQITPELFTANEHPAFGIFGYDFILDEALRLWLLEVNHGPCFPKEEPHSLKKILYEPFWQAIVNTIIMPMLSKQPTALITSSFDHVIEI